MKRSRLLIPAVCLILALMLGACNSKTSNQPQPPASGTSNTSATKEPKGTLNVIQGAEPELIDPLFSDGAAEYTVVVNIMEGLFTTGKNLEIVPVLADSAKVIDDVTWEFKLKQGIKFHNGEPFNAEAVKYTYDRALNPDEKVRNAWAGDINLKEVQIVDDYTVRFITKEPTPHVLARLANDHFIYPPKYAKEVGRDFTKKPIGTGPYKFKEWAKGQKIVLEANTEYWGEMPAIKEAVWRFVPEDGARIAELESGNADIITLLPPDQIDTLKGKATTDVVAIDGGRRVFLGLVTQGQVPTANVKVRQALNYGIDVDAIGKALFKGAISRMPNPVNPPNRNPALKGYTYDPDKARKLLAEAGYPNGFEAEFQVSAGTAIKDMEFVQAIVADLRKIGVNLKLNVMERKALNVLVANRTTAPVYLRTTAGGFDMGIDMILFRGNHSSNGTKWDNATFKELYQKVFTTVDAAKRKQYAFEAQKVLVEDAPWVFLWRQPEIYGVSKRLSGFDPQGDERIRVFQLSLKDAQ